MKKFLFIITAILALGAASVTGCADNNEKPNDGTYGIRQNSQDEDGDNDENTCPDGDCDKNGSENDFEFRFPRIPDGGIRLPDDGNGDKPRPLPRFPRRKDGKTPNYPTREPEFQP